MNGAIRLNAGALFVDDKWLTVITNLESALRVLRARSCPHVWLDAVCIQQSNEQEKSTQIFMNGAIYHHAGSVVV